MELLIEGTPDILLLEGGGGETGKGKSYPDLPVIRELTEGPWLGDLGLFAASVYPSEKRVL
jgi:hypothetical protein